MYELDLTTIQLRNVLKHNEIATYHARVHNKLFGLINNYHHYVSVLEIGAGRGISTERFKNHLDGKGVIYDYTICELDDEYENVLNKKFGGVHPIYMEPWQNLVSKGRTYDIILMTAFSTMNHEFKKLCTKNTRILTLSHYKIDQKYGFKVIKRERVGLCNVYLLQLI